MQSSTGPAVADLLLASGSEPDAPHLIDLEVSQVVRRLVARRALQPARGAAILADLVDFPMQRHAHQPLLRRIWDLRGALTAYDAAYVALAEVLAATLVTHDGRLARAAGRLVDVALV